MTAETLGAIAGTVLSLACSYVPGINDWFGKLKPDQKRAVMGSLLIVVSAAVFLFSCYNVIDAVECTQPGAIGLVEVLFAALVANQAIHKLSPKKQ